MSTFQENKFDSIEQLIFQYGLRIRNVTFNPDQKTMDVYLNTPLVITVPYEEFRPLSEATLSQLGDFELIGNGVGIHWPELDEDLSLKGFLQDFLDDLVKNGGTTPILKRVRAVA